MAYSFPKDLQDLVGERMRTGKYGSEEDLLRDALRALSEQEDDDVAAIEEAIAKDEAWLKSRASKKGGAA